MTDNSSILENHSGEIVGEVKSRSDENTPKVNGTIKSIATKASSPSEIENSDLSVSNPSSPSESVEVIAITDIGFETDQLFSLSLKFFRNYEGKAFHASYDDRNKLVALAYQVKYGTFGPDKGPPVGALDIVGRDRRQAWSELGQMSREDAIHAYVDMINQLCPLYRPFIEAHWREKTERERKEKEEQEKKRMEEEKIQLQEEEKKRAMEEIRKFDEQKRTIQEALNKQTYHQFASYAQRQYPDSPEEQQRLIRQLQEQHYEQYMQQVLQHQQMPASSNSPSPSSSGVSSIDPTDQHTSTKTPLLNHHLSSHENNYESTNDVEHQLQQKLKAHSPRTNGHHSDHESIDSSDEDTNRDSPNTSNSSGRVAAIPKIWTSKDVVPFKEQIKKEGGTDGIVKVGHGEIVTIRVPTHPEGSCLFWEFCTDYYDIGFGLLFEWTEDPGSKVSVHVQDSEDDDDEETSESAPGSPGAMSKGGDVEKQTSKMVFDASSSSSKKYKSESNLPVTVIIPIYRRDSQDEVISGSHQYPGRGVYLLKFDNSYSLWRAKTLYYRVYYTR